MSISARHFVWMGVVLAAAGQTRVPGRQDPTHSAEFGWAKKKVYETRTLEDMTSPARWTLTGRGELRFPAGGERRSLRVNVTLQGQNALPVASFSVSSSRMLAIPGQLQTAMRDRSASLKPSSPLSRSLS